MRLAVIVGALSTLMLFAGCSSYQGAANNTEFNTITDTGESNPEPAASPTFRPGLNPEDPRDAQFTTRPEPTQSPPTTKP